MPTELRDKRLFTRIQKVHQVGGSLMVVIPSEFFEAVGLKDGDEIGVYVDKDQQILRYYPIPPTGKELLTLSEETGLLIKQYSRD